MSFYVSTATFILLHFDEWDRVVALPRHKFVTGAIHYCSKYNMYTEKLFNDDFSEKVSINVAISCSE